MSHSKLSTIAKPPYNYYVLYTKKCNILKNVALVSLQIHTAVQQPGFVRVKRGLRPSVPAGVLPPLTSASSNEELLAMNNEPTDPYFPLQWYLRNTGQNGGKMRLDLNVQAAWDQGITGKNVTTAIMDDGK